MLAADAGVTATARRNARGVLENMNRAKEFLLRNTAKRLNDRVGFNSIGFFCGAPCLIPCHTRYLQRSKS
ncbi:hypothetical protein SDC9_147355 [bioreactor metagenome]|uniref:Uncharacterized protein n=1 Tax=bioreactor metagenome TaxID=1076179 RepID=A0A645EE39_9ZZZZ